MNYLKKYQLYEKSLEDAKKELKGFQTNLDLQKSLDDLLESIEAIEIKTDVIFPFLDDDENLSSLDEIDDFSNELEERGLKHSEIFNTDDFNTFARFPIKWMWIYEEDASDVEVPIYIILQHWAEKKEDWSKIKLYYVQKDITGFLDELSEVKLEIRQKDGDGLWTYHTSNSGEDWVLQNYEKATETFRKNLDWNRIITLSHHPGVEIVFF